MRYNLKVVGVCLGISLAAACSDVGSSPVESDGVQSAAPSRDGSAADTTKPRPPTMNADSVAECDDPGAIGSGGRCEPA